METAQISPDEAPNSEKLDIGKKSKVLIEKFGLTDSIPDWDKVVKTAKNVIELYKVPESFLNDDINFSLLLGCSQKLTESSDPLYRRRVDGLIKRLVEPSVEKGIIKTEELWGNEPERAGLDETAMKAYIESKVDPVATSEFVEKHKDPIAKAKAVWKDKGYDLNLKTSIVSDDVYEFRRKTRAGGFIHVPDQKDLSENSGKAEVEFVLLKGYSDKDTFVRHELYHVEDYWGYFRRGYQSSLLENLDELYTEYSCGNYDENHSKNIFGDSNYSNLKQFWDKFSYTGGLDFNIIGNRQETLEAIIKNFGFSGSVDFTLLHAHGDGRMSLFETFYSEHERPIMQMLIAKEKLNVYRIRNSGDFSSTMHDTINNLGNLKNYMTPDGTGWHPEYKSIYNLIPSKDGDIYSASEIPGNSGSKKIDNIEAKKIINSYARALAFAELYSEGELAESPDLYNEITKTLGEIPHFRSEKNFSLEGYIKKEYDRIKEYENDENKIYEDIYSYLYYNLDYEMGGIDFAFSLQNSETKDQILGPFYKELDNIAEHCIKTSNKDLIRRFIDGIYKYNNSAELRENSINHLAEKYPALKSVVEAKKTGFDPRKVASFSF